MPERISVEKAAELIRTLMPDDRFNEILNEIEEKERKDSEGEDRVLPYVLLYFQEKNDSAKTPLQMAVMAIQPELIEQKYEVLGHIGRTSYEKEFNIVAAFMMSEAWANEDPKHNGPPSEDPNRIEVIAIHGMTVDQRVNMRCIKVTRDDQDKIRMGATIMRSNYEEGKKGAVSGLLEALYESYFKAIIEKQQEKKGTDES